MSNWISVKNKLPDGYCTRVLIHPNQWEFVGYYCEKKWFTNGNRLLDKNVTHWQPIPEEPIKTYSILTVVEYSNDTIIDGKQLYYKLIDAKNSKDAKERSKKIVKSEFPFGKDITNIKILECKKL